MKWKCGFMQLGVVQKLRGQYEVGSGQKMLLFVHVYALSM